MTETTFIRPEYRRTSAGHKPVDGVQFYSYTCGILRYCRISEDGQIRTQANYRATSYRAEIIGHGVVLGAGGKAKRFQSEVSAAREAIKIWRKMQEPK